MSYRDKIKQLELLTVGLDRLITLVESNKNEVVQVNEWKKQKFSLLAELSSLRRLQWDEDHERVNFDDER